MLNVTTQVVCYITKKEKSYIVNKLINKIKYSAVESYEKKTQNTYVFYGKEGITNYKQLNIELMEISSDSKFDESFFNEIVTAALNLSKVYSRENFPNINISLRERLAQKIERLFNNDILYKKGSLLKIIGHIFFEAIISHDLPNGNKRYAASVMITLLNQFGYFHGKHKCYSDECENDILNFLILHEKRVKSDEKIKISIEKWLKKYCIIKTSKLF